MCRGVLPQVAGAAWLWAARAETELTLRLLFS